jgi:hypothetical protein
MSEVETVLSHAEEARRILESLRALQGGIKGFAVPATPLDPQIRPRGHRLLPDRFFERLATALDSSPQFAVMTTLKPAEIRDMLRYGEAYLPLADELERFARGIRYGVAIRRSTVGRAASAAYRVATSMNLLVDVDLPVPQVESMKRAIVDSRRKPEPAQPAPAPAAVTDTSP